MCTVSFVRINDAVVITSNRDEHILRAPADAPSFYELQDKKIIFPKDTKAGGTWFAATDAGVVCVLLNGAFEKHIPAPPYRTSRGLVLLEIIGSANPYWYFKKISLQDIEPFTLVLYQSAILYELRWDGNNRHEKQLDAAGNYIWSSATLYSKEIITQRQNVFQQFLRSSPLVDAAAIHHFHASDHGDAENGFVISRLTGMKTFSITQAAVYKEEIQFLHDDLQQQQQYRQVIPVHQPEITI